MKLVPNPESKVYQFFAFFGAVSSVVAAISAVYFGYRELSQPGLEVAGISEVVQSNQRVEEAVAGSSREVSDDPILQLTKRGYSFIKGDFDRAVRNADVNTIHLFCNAAQDSWLHIGEILDHEMPEASIGAIAKCQEDGSFVSCDLNHVARYDSVWIDSVNARWMVDGTFDYAYADRICGSGFIESVRVAVASK